MFDEGTILYFTPFYFNNPSETPKPKYFIVVKRIDHVAILTALPSSKKHLPYDLQTTYGCIELPDSGIGCYVFPVGEQVATNGFAFPLDSYIYGQHLDEYNMDNIFEMYPFPGISYAIKGQLLPDKLVEIIDCLKKSASVKRRYKRFL